MKAIERTGIDYYCQISDVALIHKIVQGLPKKPVCINIGAGMGTSALAMLEARPDSHVFSIDIKKCPLELEALDGSELDYMVRYSFIEGESQKVGMWFEKAWADFVFIDGGHKYEECYRDAIVWYNVLKDGGYMAFHDYESKIQVLESVKRAVDDVVKVLGLQFVERDGTMIVYRKVEDENLPTSS